jgi:hypothetical protein
MKVLRATLSIRNGQKTYVANKQDYEKLLELEAKRWSKQSNRSSDPS